MRPSHTWRGGGAGVTLGHRLREEQRDQNRMSFFILRVSAEVEGKLQSSNGPLRSYWEDPWVPPSPPIRWVWAAPRPLHVGTWREHLSFVRCLKGSTMNLLHLRAWAHRWKRAAGKTRWVSWYRVLITKPCTLASFAVCWGVLQWSQTSCFSLCLAVAHSFEQLKTTISGSRILNDGG